MIDNNKDRMSVNILPFSLDRIVRRLEDQFVDDLFQSSSSTGSTNQDQEEPDVKPLKEEPVVCVRCVRTEPGFSSQCFQVR
jgi:hypothetical protein